MELIKYKKIQWMDIVDPNPQDLQYLKRKYKFHELDLEDCLSEKEHPKIDEYSKYLFVVLHFPVKNKRQNRIQSSEVNIFLGKDFVITVHDEKLAPLKDFRESLKKSLKKRKDILSRGSGFLLYEIISTLVDSCFPLIDDIHISIKSMEKELFEHDGVSNLLKEIMIVKQNIIRLRRILLPQREVISELEYKSGKVSGNDMVMYFDDILDKIKKLWSNLEIAKEVIESLRETNESLISHNINHVMKILTIISVIMLPLTFITGLYGMNVQLPLGSSPYAFLEILAIMLVIIFCMLSFFRWNKWL